MLPGRVWQHVVRRESAVLLGASLVGLGIWASGQLTQTLWQPLATATLGVAYAVLRLGYGELHYDLAAHVLGTTGFKVTIAPSCSGYEGMGLILLLVSVYLWQFRPHLRFLQALWLFPLGLLAIWIANVGRIALLIAIGTSLSPAVALGGFHSQAGWLAFLGVGLGVVTVAHRSPCFAQAPQRSRATDTTRLATALLLPLLVLLATMMVTAAMSPGFDWLYPARVLTTGGVLWGFRRVYRRFTWTWSWQALALGVAVFGVWMLLEAPVESRTTALATGLARLSGGLAALWVGCRVLGSVLVVPLAEELAFRGYVLHKLGVPDFENVPLGRVTWSACLLSALAFGALHGRWVAGSVAGLGYALALTRRGQLADAVLAHMTTNALIAAYVLAYNAWALWV